MGYLVEFIPANQLPDADALSRLPVMGEAEDVGDEDLIIAFLENQFSITVLKIKEATACNKELTTLKQHLLCGFSESIKQRPSFIRPYFHFRNELSEIDSVILHGSQQVIVSLSLRSWYLQCGYNAYDGMARTKRLLHSLLGGQEWIKKWRTSFGTVVNVSLATRSCPNERRWYFFNP